VKRSRKPSIRPAADDPQSSRATEDDEFARAMADVIPLEDERPERVPIGSRDLARGARGTARSPVGGDSPEDVVESSFVAPGVDRRELRRLKRGDYPISRRLDLHGLNADDAISRVNRFLERSRHALDRAVCIVHGRGLNSRDGIAVLRGRIRSMLRSHRTVLAFCDAPRSDGGPGAVYVLLRR
jgi:DNA-nicking Smr family endonuclease